MSITRILNAAPDLVDVRDRYFEPTLRPLKASLAPPEGLVILDQGQEGACTGFGLAAVINRTYQLRGEGTQVSARMLYEMARRYDEWQGENYSGSSCRGAIRGWKNMGVCTASVWPYTEADTTVTKERALDARSQTLGAYYRLRKDIVDFHSALNEVGVIYASASVHEGWRSPEGGDIAFSPTNIGGHAFAIVGYDAKGFFVQNSWGTGWGQNGIARWLYEDWIANLVDAWVIQLALPTPQLWETTQAVRGGEPSGASAQGSVERHEIAGHFVHFDDGAYADVGRYWSNAADVGEIVKSLGNSEAYDHVVLFAHGGLVSPAVAAQQTRAMKAVWKENGVYPIHFLYDTGLFEEAKDILFKRAGPSEGRAGDAFDLSDRVLERSLQQLGRALWREMKAGARSPFAPGGGGTDFLGQLAAAMNSAKRPMQLHLVGHSAGSILLAHLIERLAANHASRAVASVSLLAPAATVALFEQLYRPNLASELIKDMTIYNLVDRLELADSVGPYKKSLLYLIARSFEDNVGPKLNEVALLGMDRFSSRIPIENLPLRILLSHGPVGDAQPVTTATSHSGFAGNSTTFNSVLRRILGREPKRLF